MAAEDGTLDFTINKLILGDNLEILKGIPDESVDLIYLDPPFFSNQNYEVIWGDEGEIRSFQDRWAGGIDHYIGWLYERVEQMHRILKSTGSIYLHCDWHADAYIRVHILDKIFGINNFRNEIAWCYRGAGYPKKDFGRRHDTIYRYSKTNGYIFNLNDVREPYAQATQERFKHYIGNVRNGVDFGQQALNPLGRHPDDWWEIQPIAPSAKERIGYPTQKPEPLLEKIIKASSNKGDIVLDPFVGGGTTVVVADRLGRQWIGIDQSPAAIKITDFRLEKQFGTIEKHKSLFPAPYIVQLHKYDEETLFTMDAFKFETWIIQQYGGVPHHKKGADKGVDGKTKDGTPIQVKQSRDIGVNVVKNFFVSAEQYNKYCFAKNIAEKTPAGYIIAFSFGRGAVEEAARLKIEKNVIIKLVPVKEIVSLSAKPTIMVITAELEINADGSRKIEFTASANSLSGIEFYSWDFNYDIKKKKFKPAVMMDKTGRQIMSLPNGTYNIAVKVVDNDGLENIEVITLKINGAVHRV